MKISTAMMPTTVVSKSDVGDDLIREKVAAVLVKFKTKTIEGAGDLSDEGVRLLKNRKRTISTETLFKLVHAKGELGPAIWKVICELSGRSVPRIEHDSPQMNDLFGALHALASTPGPHGEFARALVSRMNRDGATATIEALPAKKPPAETVWHPDNVVQDLFERRRA